MTIEQIVGNILIVLLICSVIGIFITINVKYYRLMHSKYVPTKDDSFTLIKAKAENAMWDKLIQCPYSFHVGEYHTIILLYLM